MKIADTLFCIADDHSFRLLRGGPGRMQAVQAATAADFPDVSKTLTEPGRNRAVGVSFTHETGAAIEVERPRLAKHIVAAMQGEWKKGGADRIVVLANAAAREMFGELRKAMPKDLAQAIVRQHDKDLSDVPDHALAEHLARLA